MINNYFFVYVYYKVFLIYIYYKNQQMSVQNESLAFYAIAKHL